MFWGVFAFFSRDFRGSVGIKNPFPHPQKRKISPKTEGQGCCLRYRALWGGIAAILLQIAV